jgi:hypothetical protein
MLNITAIAATHNLRQQGNRYIGPCPKCGGSATSDKFQIRDDGGFKCYACGFKGDAITWLREIDGLSCPEAFEAAGLACTRTTCPVYAGCRMGEGKHGQRPPRLAASVQVPPVKAVRERLTAPRDPAATWLQWASGLLAKAQANLQSDRATLDYLAGRGIGLAAATAHGLGVLTHPQKPNRQSIGLPPERNGKTALWIPAGLVIPTMAGGALHRLRIRRTVEDRAKFCDDLKYVWIEGSGKAPLLIEREQARGTVIVEAELDAIACAAAHAQINVIALGTVDMPVTAAQHQLLQQTPVILVALDADAESAAGQKAVKGWLASYRHAKAWPVPLGKDPGDYVAAGHQLSSWLSAGLPPSVQALPANQDNRPDTLQASPGGAGPVDMILLRGTSRLGVDFAVVASEKYLNQAQQEAPGAVFFTPAEWRSCLGMSPEEADAVMMAKQVFNGTIQKREIGGGLR